MGNDLVVFLERDAYWSWLVSYLELRYIELAYQCAPSHDDVDVIFMAR